MNIDLKVFYHRHYDCSIFLYLDALLLASFRIIKNSPE